MEEHTNNLFEKIEALNKESKFKDIIDLLSDEVLVKEKSKVAELYVWRGYTWHDLKEYDKAIADYGKALKHDPNYHLAFYNRGLVWVIKRDYDKAIDDFTKAIENATDYAGHYYNDRGNVWKAIKIYDKAIDDYTKAIEISPTLAKAYYGRGLAKKEKLSEKEKNIDLNEIKFDLNEIKFDFDKYLDITKDEKDIGTKYAHSYIEGLKELVKTPELWSIGQLINDIKNILLINGNFITHYTSLSVLESLIQTNSKFRISEGNFMNDPSEGKEFFDFLHFEPYTSYKNGSSVKIFSPKPFIGSFVTEDKFDDLNMWRFYGKEKGVEAKGCAITLRKQEFINDIKDLLSNEENREARLEDESDINFYHVVYVTKNGSDKFYVPKSINGNELESLMTELKEKVGTYTKKVKDRISIEKYLNRIAFLFKSDEYKNENEIRLVLKGIEFKKKCNNDLIPPRVYIELESIKNVVKQITLGPKVDRGYEWASTIHYSYEDNAPEIIISNLPYK